MEKRPKSENELIQEGLERFLEKELRGVSFEKEQKSNISDSKREQDLQVIIPNEQRQKPLQVFANEDIGGLDLDFDEPVSKRSSNMSGTDYNERVLQNNNSGNKKNRGSNLTEDNTRNGNRGNIRNHNQSNNRSNPRNHNQSSNRGNNRNNNENGCNRKDAYGRGGNQGKNMSGKEKRKKKKRFSGLKKLAVFLITLFLIIAGVMYALVGSVYKKMEYERVDSYATEPMKEKGVINILLIGNDSRENGEDGRSDAMILVSISDKTKTITMTSLLRDMYVEIPGHDGNRLNAAYSYGGPELLMETIELNFDIPVHRYALVNFQAFANLVDAVGGVELELTNEEVQYVNGYLVEYNMLENRPEGTDYLDTSLSGTIHLNGPQALAYTRNRYIGTDFGRTERQRKVLEAVMKKMPATLAVNSSELIDGLFPNLKTNLTQSECFNLSLNASKLLTYEQVQQAIPADGTYSNATIRSMAVLEVDFEANKKILKETIYGEK